MAALDALRALCSAAVARRTLRSGSMFRHIRLGLLLVALLAPGLAVPADDGSTVLERRVKAALLYRFLNYVEWPEASSAGAPLTIGVVAADALATELAEATAGRVVNARPIVVRVLRPAEVGRADVHLLFIGRSEASQLSTLLRAVPPGVLIITESDDALQQGSIINLVLIEGQVRFEVSLDSARRRNIRLSARLLSVAHNVYGAPL
jgi:hypothetical protein